MEPFSELLLRVLDDATNNKKPSETDLSELRLIAQDIDRVRNVVGGWIGADGNPNVRSITSQSGRFDDPPIHAGFLSFSATVPATTNTYFTFTNSVPRGRISDMWEVGTGSETIQLKIPPNARAILLFGFMLATSGGSGATTIYGEQYDIDGAHIGGSDFQLYSQSNSASFWVPIGTPVALSSQANGLKLYCYTTVAAGLSITGKLSGILIF